MGEKSDFIYYEASREKLMVFCGVFKALRLNLVVFLTMIRSGFFKEKERET